VRSISIFEYVCLSLPVGLSVRAQNLKNDIFKLHEIFYTYVTCGGGSVLPSVSYVLPVLWMTSCFQQPLGDIQMQAIRDLFIMNRQVAPGQ